MFTSRVAGIAATMLMVLALTACGGGAVAADSSMGVTSFSPGGMIASDTEQPFLIEGWGFGPVGDPCPVRLTATAGTPFQMGTMATLDGPARIEDGSTIRGVLTAAQVLPSTGPVTATIELVLPDGSTFPLDGMTATFAELEYTLRVASVEPEQGSVLGGTSVTLEGVGFNSYDPGPPRVWFGSQEATDVLVADDRITCTAPAHPVGLATVRVENALATASAPDAYEYCATCSPDWEYGPVVAEGVAAPDMWIPYAQGFEFPWYGVPTSSLHIGPMGDLDSEAGASLWVLGGVDTMPAGAGIHCKQLGDRVVVTYSDVAETGGTGRSTVQVILHESGAFAVMYLDCGFAVARLGLQSPVALSNDDVDWTSEPSGNGSNAMIESFDSENPCDLVGYGILFEPNAAGGYDSTLFDLDP